MNYTANDIVSLSAGRAFREKIGMYLSADRQEAINLGLRELIVNVQDEYEVYKPTNPFLRIILDSHTHQITVEDNMRGIPVGLRDDGMNSLTAAFLIPHSGGKHIEGAYSSAVGINGEGNKVVCHTAKWLEVKVMRDGEIWFQRFESDDEGAKALENVKSIGKCGEQTGTYITYVPDRAVYGDVFIDIDNLRQMLREISYFTIGLQIQLIIDGEKEVFISKNGLIDGLNTTNAMSKPFSFFYETEDCKVELALQWVSKSGEIRGYANGLYMPDGGVFISQFKSSLTRTFNSLAKTKYSGDQIRDVLDGFVSVKVKVGQFSNQAKTALANKEAGTATSAAITNALKEFVYRRGKDFDKVVELLNKVQKAEAAAERARKQVLEAVKDIEKGAKAKILSSDKLRDARKLGEDSILLCCEGLSAGGSMSIGRDPNKYGILMLRGKAKNLLSCPIEEGLVNEEVKLMLQALGINYGQTFNPKKLRYGKVALASDADFDGSHVGLLIMAMLQVLCPDFIKENRLYWLRAPIYKVKTKNEVEFFYTEEEFQHRKNKGTEIIKYKGLGQMSDEDLKLSMFSEKFQRLEPITYSEEGVAQLISLMGNDSAPKKEFVFNNIDFGVLNFE